MKNHKHYEAARRAHYHTSFTPEKRAEDFCTAFDSGMQELEALGVPSYQREKYEALVIKHLQAKARCMSSMITGPANFPVRRAEKANRIEHARSLECSAYYDKIVKHAEREAYYAANPNARPVLLGDSDALERLKLKLEDAKKYHAQLKQVKALVKTGISNEEASQRAGLSSPVAWHSFNIQYANKAVKDLEAKIASLSSAKDRGTTEQEIAGVRVVENTEAMRLQLFFDGKPAPEVIRLLKAHGLKWAPSQSAWQRQLTASARYSVFKLLVPQLKALAA